MKPAAVKGQSLVILVSFTADMLFGAENNTEHSSISSSSLKAYQWNNSEIYTIIIFFCGIEVVEGLYLNATSWKTYWERLHLAMHDCQLRM